MADFLHFNRSAEKNKAKPFIGTHNPFLQVAPCSRLDGFVSNPTQDHNRGVEMDNPGDEVNDLFP